MNISTESKINRLLKFGQKRGLYFSGWLSRQGYSPQLIDRYRSSGWLSALSRGVVYRTGSSLSAFGALASYNQQVEKDLRIAAHSALELWGFNHYVPMGKPILVVGMDKKTAPHMDAVSAFRSGVSAFFFVSFVYLSGGETPLSRLGTAGLHAGASLYGMPAACSQKV